MSQSIGATAPLHPSALTSRETSLVRRALSVIESKRLKSGPILCYFEDFQQYLILRFAGLSHEQGHILYLDIDQRLIDADVLAFGNQSKVSWDIRHIAYRAMALGAEHVVMAHNHPSDNPTPSEADVANLTAFENGLRMVGINLLESYVVTSKRITSIKHYRKLEDDARHRQWREERERASNERRAKMAATKAAKHAAQFQGVAA